MNQPLILVTGGTGFAGSHLVEHLLAKGYTNVHTTCFHVPEESELTLPYDHYHQVDLTKTEDTKVLFDDLRPDWIFHLASFAYVGKSFDKAPELFENNINLQLSVLEAVRQVCPQARLLTIGSAEEYGVIDEGTALISEACPLNPVNPYAISKVTQDLLAQSYFLSFKLNVLRTRSFNHIGTGQTGDFAVPAFVQQIVKIERGEQEKLFVGNLEGVRDFTSVDDMVDAYILLMEKGEVGDVYNIGTGKGYHMQEIIDILCSLSTATIVLERDETRLRPLDVPRLVADNSKIRALGWNPTKEISIVLQEVLEEWRQK